MSGRVAQLGAYVLIVAVAVLGFVQIEQVTQRNTRVVDCVTEWVYKNTDALQDRDAVNKTVLAAEREMWTDLHQFLSTRQESRRPMLQTIGEYRLILRRLARQEAIDPYPDISGCLDSAPSTDFALMASSRRLVRTCFGRAPTILGTHGADTIHGTDGQDVILSRGGDDLIIAGKGRDLICSGRGADTVNGSQHFDKARGGRGRDHCVQVERTFSCG